MDFLDRLRRLSIEHGYANNMQLSKASGIPYTTLDGFYRSGYDNVKLSTLRKLSECLNCSIEYLVNGDPSTSEEPSPSALEIARKYDQLDERGQQVVSGVIDIELNHSNLKKRFMEDAARRIQQGNEQHSAVSQSSGR